MVFLEDDDVVTIKDGSLAIHCNVDDSTVREVITLKMEIQQIMKGETQGQREFPDQYSVNLLIFLPSHIPVEGRATSAPTDATGGRKRSHVVLCQ